jgi:drug/metabolite transporter (DMT)-like permease
VPIQQQLLVLLLCCLYGSVFSVAKLALEQAPPLFITGTRMLLAGCLLLAYQYYKYPKTVVLRKAHLLPIFIVGFSGVYLTNALEFWGLQFMEAGKACFIYSFSPIATAILSYFFFAEKISFKKWVGLIMGILGFVPIFLAQESITDDSAKLGFFSYAEIALLLAAIATAVGWIVMRSMVKKHAISAILGNGYTMLVGGAIALTHSFISETWDPTPVIAWWPFIAYFVALTIISNLIAYNLHAHLLKTFTASYLSFAGLSQPFFAAAFGWIFLGEIMPVEFWMSLFAVIVGIYLYYQEELRQGILVHKTKQSKK